MTRLLWSADSLTYVENALRQVKDSENLRVVFKHVLAFGNYMNAGTAKGAAYGFKLEAINRVRNYDTMCFLTVLFGCSFGPARPQTTAPTCWAYMVDLFNKKAAPRRARF